MSPKRQGLVWQIEHHLPLEAVQREPARHGVGWQSIARKTSRMASKLSVLTSAAVRACCAPPPRGARSTTSPDAAWCNAIAFILSGCSAPRASDPPGRIGRRKRFVGRAIDDVERFAPRGAPRLGKFDTFAHFACDRQVQARARAFNLILDVQRARADGLMERLLDVLAKRALVVGLFEGEDPVDRGCDRLRGEGVAIFVRGSNSSDRLRTGRRFR